LEVIAQEYQKVLDMLNQASQEVDGVETALNTFQQTLEGFNDKANEVDALIKTTGEKIKDVRNAGFRTSFAEGILDKANQSLQQSRLHYKTKYLIKAMKSLDSAKDSASQASRYIDELPQKKQEIENGTHALGLRVEEVKNHIIRGREIFDRISDTYAESSWEPVEGNGTEAENRVNWTLEALEKARNAANMEQQNWPAASEALKQGNTWMDEAEAFMHSISAIEANLQTARRDSPVEISAAQADITGAWKYINAYDEDIRESLEDDLREAEKKLKTASEELNKDKVDYLIVVKLAREANESADKILVQARTEHETAERMRSKAASSLRDARSKVSIAREYIRDHTQEAGDESRRHLANAEAVLRQSESAGNLNSQIALAETAENAADAAYTSARNRVQEAWQRQQSMVPPVIILPGGYRTGRQSWGSHRSSPWGSGGGGSGGGRSGGGSTGWSAGRSGGGRSGGGSTRW
jgi:hypothetical protein